MSSGNGLKTFLVCFRSIEIPCVIVKGIYKTPFHIVGTDDLAEFKCTWNSVYMDGGWHIIHPYLICTPLSTKTQNQNWTLVETSKVNDSPRPGAVLNTFFFAPNPGEFVHCCRPEDSNSSWQLLDEPWSYEQFIKAPFVRPAYFTCSMSLISKANCVLLAHDGKCNIRVKCDSERVGDLNIMYELYSLDSDFKLGEDFGKIVMCGRNEETWNVQIKFPVAGTFKLALYGQIFDWFFWLGKLETVFFFFYFLYFLR